MAKKAKKATRTGTASVVKDCEAVKQIKELAKNIAATQLPAGASAATKTKLAKLSGRVYAGADSIQKGLVHSSQRIASVAKKRQKLLDRVAKDQKAIEALSA